MVFTGGFVYLALFGVTFLSWILDRTDVCPSCGQNISMLPSEGHLRLPELSHKIRCCPHCAADFSFEGGRDDEPSTS